MVEQRNWWCPPEEYQDVQDDWFVHFFQQGSEMFLDMDHHKIHVYTIFGNRSTPSEEEQKENVNFLFVGENVSFETMMHHPLHSTMDSVLTFFHESPKSIRLPLWMIYWNFYKDGLFESQLGSNDRYEKGIIIVSHDTHGIRNQICSKLRNECYLPIDSNFEGVDHDMIVNIPRRGTIYKRQLLQKYTYNICAENAYNPGYVTEKVFQSLEAGCIPIYWGNCPTEPSILNQEYIVDATMSPMRLVSKIEQIQKDAPSTKDIWNPDALISIFSTYLKMWSVVVKKLKPSKLNPSYPIIYYNYCRSLEECAEKLVSHWRVSKKLWYPRIHFRMYVPETRDNKEIWMEDLADLLYDRYKTTIIS